MYNDVEREGFFLLQVFFYSYFWIKNFWKLRIQSHDVMCTTEKLVVTDYTHSLHSFQLNVLALSRAVSKTVLYYYYCFSPALCFTFTIAVRAITAFELCFIFAFSLPTGQRSDTVVIIITAPGNRTCVTRRRRRRL